MEKRIYTILILFLSASFLVLGQKARFDRLDNFEKIILDQKIKNIYLKSSGSEHIEIEGVDKSAVSITQTGDQIRIQINGTKENLSIFISNNNLRRIEARKDADIYGAEVLAGGNGKFLVRSIGGDNLSKDEYAFDFDFDFDFDYDFSSDFNQDIESDWYWNFSNWQKEWKFDFKWDAKSWMKKWNDDPRRDINEWDIGNNWNWSNEEVVIDIQEYIDIVIDDIEIDVEEINERVNEQIREVIREVEEKRERSNRN